MSTTQRPPNASPLPLWVHAISLIALAYILFPLIIMTARVPWAHLPQILSQDAAQSALWLSLHTSAIALLINLLIGVPLAVWIAKGFPGVALIRILIAIPLSLPPVVAGIALLSAFGRRGPLGGLIDAWGWNITFTTTAVIMAQVFISLPFLVVTLESALRARPQGLEETAAALGASPTRILTHITLPSVFPGLLRAIALSLARCLGEFGATLTFAGSRQGVTRTMPLEIYLAREDGVDSALALGILLLIVATVVVALTEMPTLARLLRQRSTSPPPSRQAFGTGSPEASAPSSSNPAGEAATETPRDLPKGSDVSISGQISAREWSVDLDLPAGSVTALMGRNGSGKSTLGLLLAGQLRLDSGTVNIGEKTVDDGRIYLPARQRRVTIVSQEPRIFTHMSVLDNVAFPLRCRGFSKAKAAERAMEELRQVDSADLAARRGDELSGGQAAKVALARALACEPRVLILDEPTAALDVEASASVSRILRDRLRVSAPTTLLITHDMVEAITLAQRVAIMEGGRIAEVGAPAELFGQPSSVFTANLAGLNIVQGQVESAGEGMVVMRLGGARLMALGEGAAAAQAFLFAPEAVALYREQPSGSPRGIFPARVESAQASGNLVTVTLRIDEKQSIRARVTASAWAELAAAPGEELWCAVKATQVRAIDLPVEGASPAEI
ncbi:MAG: ABC transporter permease [Actinomycetaceae bacterium]|nr:ABC transporter permease [Actinomycetaceae bacterium]